MNSKDGSSRRRFPARSIRDNTIYRPSNMRPARYKEIYRSVRIAAAEGEAAEPGSAGHRFDMGLIEYRDTYRSAIAGSHGYRFDETPAAIAKRTKHNLRTRRLICGNDGVMESMESQKQAFHPFHNSLENSHKTLVFHISTAPATGTNMAERNTTAKTMGGGKVEIKNQDSHFSTAPRDSGATDPVFYRNDNRKEPQHSANLFHPFRPILGLENAARFCR